LISKRNCRISVTGLAWVLLEMLAISPKELLKIWVPAILTIKVSKISL